MANGTHKEFEGFWKTTFRISRDLKSLVGTGDPKQPCKKQSQTPSIGGPMILWQGGPLPNKWG